MEPFISGLKPGDFWDGSNHYVQLMVTAQSDAATNYNSAFKVWYRKSISYVDNTATTAYNTADNSYYNAHQPVPAVLDSWNTDIEQVFTDTINYTNDQEQVFADQQLGNDATSDQQAVNNDLQAYKSDLNKAQNDIKQI